MNLFVDLTFDHSRKEQGFTLKKKTQIKIFNNFNNGNFNVQKIKADKKY